MAFKSLTSDHNPKTPKPGSWETGPKPSGFFSKLVQKKGPKTGQFFWFPCDFVRSSVEVICDDTLDRLCRVVITWSVATRNCFMTPKLAVDLPMGFGPSLTWLPSCTLCLAPGSQTIFWLLATARDPKTCDRGLFEDRTKALPSHHGHFQQRKTKNLPDSNLDLRTFTFCAPARSCCQVAVDTVKLVGLRGINSPQELAALASS